MNLFYLSIGSNHHALDNISKVLGVLDEKFSSVQISNIYKNLSLDKDTNYYNLAVSFSAACTCYDLKLKLKTIEKQLGRSQLNSKLSLVSIDLDIIRVDNLSTLKTVFIDVEQILKHSFILAPLADIADDLICPKTDKSYFQLWSEYDKTNHPLEKIVTS